MSSLVRVQFTKGYHAYNKGEIVSFPPHVASKMVEIGVAQRSDNVEAKTETATPVQAKVRTRNRTPKPEVIEK